jgi:hypothetical protein
MPKIDPIVLGTILINYQKEIYELYLLSANQEVCERLLVLHEKIGEMILTVESLVVKI